MGKQIKDFPAAAAAALTDRFGIDDVAGLTKKVTGAQLAALVNGAMTADEIAAALEYTPADAEDVTANTTAIASNASAISTLDSEAVKKTGAQTVAGVKTFSNAPILSSLTAGSIPFIGTDGVVSQDNAALFWDATNDRLGIRNPNPGSALDVAGMGRFTTGDSPPSGAGTEVDYITGTGTGRVSAFDRSASAWKALQFRGSTIALAPNGTTVATATATGLGVNCTPAQKLEAQDSSGASQIAFGEAANRAYLTGYSALGGAMSYGARYTGAAWEARISSASVYLQTASYHQWMSNSGLTSGVTYTPTVLAYLNATGLSLGPSAAGCKLDAPGTIRATGSTPPTSGTGIEQDWTGTLGRLVAIDRSTGTFKEVSIQGSKINTAPSGTNVQIIDSNRVQFLKPAYLASYTVATLPSAAGGYMVFCSNEAGGPTVVYYDGTNWRRVYDNAIAS